MAKKKNSFPTISEEEFIEIAGQWKDKVSVNSKKMIPKGYIPKHKFWDKILRYVGGVGYKPRCTVCGQFVSYDAPSNHVLDTEYSAEKIEYFCEECWRKENE
jgi:hypothetical protein